jgi:hypothetical protein
MCRALRISVSIRMTIDVAPCGLALAELVKILM